MNYHKDILIPLYKSSIALYTKSKLKVCNSYERIVIGGRGAYIEFDESDLVKSHFETGVFFIPENKKWKTLPEYKNKIYYYELRTKPDNVKIYYQLDTVNYADYKVDKFYISPNELYTKDGRKITLKNV